MLALLDALPFLFIFTSLLLHSHLIATTNVASTFHQQQRASKMENLGENREKPLNYSTSNNNINKCCLGKMTNRVNARWEIIDYDTFLRVQHLTWKTKSRREVACAS